MSPKVLIVDDASFIREILKNIASKQGWNICAEAEDGEEAIKMCLLYRPDIIIMDIVMPKMSGIESGKQILRKFPEMPIIGLSTMNQEEIMAQAIEAGFVSYITKPFENWTIITAVQEALGRKERKSG